MHAAHLVQASAVSPVTRPGHVSYQALSSTCFSNWLVLSVSYKSYYVELKDAMSGCEWQTCDGIKQMEKANMLFVAMEIKHK